MATKEEELHYIGQTGFEAIEIFFGQSCAAPVTEEKRSLYHCNQPPLKTIPSPIMVYQRTQVSQVPESLYAPPLPPRPPRNFPFGRLLQSKQRKRMIDQRNPMQYPLPLGPYQVQYPPQELYGYSPEDQVPEAEAATIDNIKAAQMYGGVTRIDYGRYN